MKNYVDFDMIEVVDDGGSYPILLRIGWDNNSMEVINFKMHVMKFENQDIRVITPMDPNGGQRYIEPVKINLSGMGSCLQHLRRLYPLES